MSLAAIILVPCVRSLPFPARGVTFDDLVSDPVPQRRTTTTDLARLCTRRRASGLPGRFWFLSAYVLGVLTDAGTHLF